ncbi:MAG: hypothetical protein LBJ44_06755 [Propionibacteriaceae bacterium]|nr:hypothetical protein [Propionibacteriaceae bacterium]
MTTNQTLWSAFSDAAWLSVTPASGASGASISLVAEQNYGPARSAVVTVTAGGASARIAVSQGSAPAAAMTLSRTSWAPGAEGASVSVTPTTNQIGWSVVSDAAWLSAAPDSGVTKAAVSVTATANSTPSSRVGHLTFSSVGPMPVATRVLTVTQGAATISVGRTTWTPLSTGETITPEVSTNQPSWTASASADWLSVSPASGVDGEEMVWVGQANTSGASRTATITITAGGATRVVNVSQPARSVTVTLSRTTWSAPAAAGSVDLKVTSTEAQWTASSDSPWLTLSQDTGPTGRITVVSVDANPTGSSRVGVLTISSGGATKTLKVTQAAGPAKVTVSVTSWTAPAGGGALPLTAVSATGATWKVTESATWLSVSPTGSIASGATRTLTATANTTTARREAVITVTAGGVSTTITVVQDTTRTLTASKTSWSVSASGSSTTASIDTYNDQSWTATADQPWLVVGPPSSPTDDTVTIVAQPNPGPARTGTITIHSGTQTATITVSQR